MNKPELPNTADVLEQAAGSALPSSYQQLSKHFSTGWGGRVLCSHCFVHWGQRRGSVKCSSEEQSRSQQKRGIPCCLPSLPMSECCLLIRFFFFKLLDWSPCSCPGCSFLLCRSCMDPAVLCLAPCSPGQQPLALIASLFMREFT